LMDSRCNHSKSRRDCYKCCCLYPHINCDSWCIKVIFRI